MGIGALVAKGLPAPGKLPKRRPAPAEEGAEGEMEPDDAGDDEAAELSAMEAFDNAEGAEERLAALKDLLAICKPGY